MGLARRSLVTPCPFLSFFLSLTLFFRLIPWSTEVLCVHSSAWVSKTWTGRHSASSLPQETRKAPVASVNRANFLSQSFIGFLRKPRNISLFLSSIFLSTIFFPYLSLNHPPTPFFLQVPLDPAGAGPWHLSKIHCCYIILTTTTKLLQRCPTLCDPKDDSPPGSPVPEILQARTLEWVAISSSRGSSQPREWTQVSLLGSSPRRIQGNLKEKRRRRLI